ncbi:MAG: hypothetical protein ACYTDT_01430 [Planctomycetota bacterium]|jgi:hypothetical protein
MAHLNVTIFSKDRAAQLDGLLRSIREKVARWETAFSWTVIYAASTADFRQGYETVQSEHGSSAINFVAESDREHSFKEIVIEAMSQQYAANRSEWYMFLVDDMIFKTNWGFDSAKPLDRLQTDTTVIAASLRLCPRYDYCYAENRAVKPPFKARFGRWNWRKASGDWGYPMSVDGNIFRYEDIIPIVKKIDFRHPNSFESELAKNAIKARPKMTCYKEAVVVNLPINKVQSEYENRAGEDHGISAEDLNKLFLAGKRVDLEPVYKLSDNRGCHHEMPLRLT